MVLNNSASADGVTDNLPWLHWHHLYHRHDPPPAVPEVNSALVLLPIVLVITAAAQQPVEIVISGYETQAEAETAFRREIATLLEIGSDNLVAAVSRRWPGRKSGSSGLASELGTLRKNRRNR